jgi:putative DNA methylase
MSAAVQRLPVANRTDDRPAAYAEPQTLLEADFPYAEVSALARRDRFSNDHVYAVHKWWARRPPAVIRALLLAAVLPAGTSEADFWAAFAAEDMPLEGKVVGDPFLGGATSLVEASRLGADVTGIDVDPLAVRVARVELGRLDAEDFARQGQKLLAHLRGRHACLYPAEDDGVAPLHYFWLREAECGGCGESSLIYRDPWLVRDRGRAGAVVREEGGVAFCPDCRALHRLEPDRKTFNCCGRRHRLDRGTYSRGRFGCPRCGVRVTNEELAVGTLPSRLIAVEETVEGKRRRLREPEPEDLAAVETASSLDPGAAARLAATGLEDVDSGRPASYGFASVADLFGPRQLAVFADAFAWIRGEEAKGSTRDALLLAASNALGANNRLCGYATDYGRLSALFSGVRAYSMPVLSVELNPLHQSAGRGTIAATLRRVGRSASSTVRRHALTPGGEMVDHEFPAHGEGRRALRCSSADRALPLDLGRFDLVLTDPPYFDFIPYSDLSLLYRAWLAPEAEAERLGGAPIYPVGDDAVAEFAGRLGRAFSNVREALSPGAPLVFTFHSANPDAWEAVERALAAARFSVHAVFPVWADGRSGSHGHEGNCEWDLVFVCRAGGPRPMLRPTIEGWKRRLGEERLEQSDLRSMALGLEMARRLGS